MKAAVELHVWSFKKKKRTIRNKNIVISRNRAAWFSGGTVSGDNWQLCVLPRNQAVDSLMPRWFWFSAHCKSRLFRMHFSFISCAVASVQKYNEFKRHKASQRIRSGQRLYENFMHTNGRWAPANENVVRTKQSGFTVFIIVLFFIFVLRKKENKAKDRMKEEEIEKGDCRRPTRKVFFFEILSDLNQAVPNHLADESQTR